MYAIVVCTLLFVLFAMMILRSRRKREEAKFKVAQSILVTSGTTILDGIQSDFRKKVIS